MPLVAHSSLPSFERLRQAGEEVLDLQRARVQDIRELHVGLLNIMPDAALAATERQFLRLVGSSNRIAQFYVHPFTLPAISRGAEAQAYIDEHYTSFDAVKRDGLDALIITGANLPGVGFDEAEFWPGLVEVMEFARERVTSTLCACLATHAALYHLYGLEREPLGDKRWGVYPHRSWEPGHPLVRDTNTLFDVPHSRFNDVPADSMRNAGVRVLVGNEEAGAHLAVSPDGLRFVFFQGHPEYDRDSLLKEYKRESLRFLRRERPDKPPYPTRYFGERAAEVVENWWASNPGPDSEFPEGEVLRHVDNTWGDTARTTFNNWLGLVYQLTNEDRHEPFMDGVDPEDPLGLGTP